MEQQQNQQQTQQTHQQPTNTYAIIALVAAISGFMGFALVGPVVGIIFARMAKKEIAGTGQDGLGMAKAAEIISWIQIALTVMVIFGIIALILIGFLTSSAV